MNNSNPTFLLTEPPADLGAEEYSLRDNSKNARGRKKILRSPFAIYLFALLAFLVFWFLYSLINALAVYKSAKVLLGYISSFFVLVTCVAIVVCSVFGLWGKLTSFALSHGMVKRHDAANAAAHAQMTDEAYEKAQKPSPVFRVYGGYIYATDNNGKLKLYDRNQIKRVNAYRRGRFYKLALVSRGYDFAWSGVQFSKKEIKKLGFVFGDLLVICDEREDGTAKSLRKAARESISVSVAPIIVGLICAAAGGGLIAMHFYVSASMPVVLGAFFIAGGAIFFCAGFESFPVVKVFAIPLLSGGVFTVIPPLFCVIISNAQGTPVIFESAHAFLSSFSPLFGAAGFLCGMGVLLIIVAFYGLIKYIRTGES